MKIKATSFRELYWRHWAKKKGYDPDSVELKPRPYSDEVDVFVRSG